MLPLQPHLLELNHINTGQNAEGKSQHPQNVCVALFQVSSRPRKKSKIHHAMETLLRLAEKVADSIRPELPEKPNRNCHKDDRTSLQGRLHLRILLLNLNKPHQKI